MGHESTPPELPEIRDEAANSPRWLPWLGIGLFVLFAGWLVLTHTVLHDG
jgi:hypothetical protein